MLKFNLANEMLNNLEPKTKLQKKASSDLSQAIDNLNNAIDILESVGYKKTADKVFNVLLKLSKNEDLSVPSSRQTPFKVLMDIGITQEDLVNIAKGNHLATAKLNKKLREVGYDEEKIKLFLKDKYISKKETDELLDPSRAFGKIDEWLKDPLKNEIIFNSLANDFHTQGLTSEKMTKNLLDHGTEFNMSDDFLNMEINEVDDLIVDDEKDFEDD